MISCTKSEGLIDAFAQTFTQNLSCLLILQIRHDDDKLIATQTGREVVLAHTGL